MKRLTTLTAALVFLIAAAGFTLSYSALHAYAADNGITFALAWLWPLVIDGFMLVISLSILRASLLQEPVKYLWALAILATVISIGFNIAHAPATWAGRAVATIAPLAMFAAFEVFISQIRRNSERNALQESYKALQAMHAAAQAEIRKTQELLHKAQAQAQAMKEEHASLKAQIKEAQAELKATQAEIKKAQAEANEAQGGGAMWKLISHYTENPTSTQTDAAQAVGVSRQRVSQLLKEIRTIGASQNGHVESVS